MELFVLCVRSAFVRIPCDSLRVQRALSPGVFFIRMDSWSCGFDYSYTLSLHLCSVVLRPSYRITIVRPEGDDFHHLRPRCFPPASILFSLPFLSPLSLCGPRKMVELCLRSLHFVSNLAMIRSICEAVKRYSPK